MKTYYPETTIIKGLARVHRERKLPLHTAPKPTHTMTGMSVDAIHVVLEGDVLREYRILDAGEALGIRDPNQLAEFILVSEGQRVQYGQEIAQRGRGRRSKVLSAPADGEITRIEDTQIVLQIAETTIEVMAKIPGQIDEIEQYTVQITGHGALIQCAWGNGAFCYEAFRFVPEGGFVELSKLDVRISEYRRVVLISPNAISKGDLLVAQQQEVAGVVAPSMPSNLREFAMRLTFPVLLTEGFGRRRPTALIYSLLQSNMGRQAAFDAVVPDHWAGDRPEIMIPLPSGGVTPPVPMLERPLAVGAHVRITRAPWDGLNGEVVDIPSAPQVIDNGLRLPCAKVQLGNGRIGVIPLANLELLG